MYDMMKESDEVIRVFLDLADFRIVTNLLHHLDEVAKRIAEDPGGNSSNPVEAATSTAA